MDGATPLLNQSEAEGLGLSQTKKVLDLKVSMRDTSSLDCSKETASMRWT